MLELMRSKGGLRELERSVRENPCSAEAHYYLGLYYFNKERELQKAKQELEKAIKCNKHFVEPYKALAECLLIELKPDEAKGKLQEALQMAPKNPSINGSLGTIFNDERKFKEAARLLKRALRWEKNKKQARIWRRKMDEIRRYLPSSKAYWSMARKDGARSSRVEWENRVLVPTPLWPHHYAFFKALEEDVKAVPSPVITVTFEGSTRKAAIVIADASLGAFVALDVDKGERVWSSGKIIEKFAYFNTPVILEDSLLLFITDGCLKGSDISQQPIRFQDIMVDKRIKPSSLSTPLVYEEMAIFCLEREVLIYDSLIGEGYFIDIELEENDILLSPIVFEDKLMCLSRHGVLFEVDLRNFEFEGKIGGKKLLEGICSPPCISGTTIYFEAFAKARRIYAYDPKDTELVEKVLPGEHCSPEHLHFDFPPVAYKDGVLISSDIESPPKFYQVRRAGNCLERISIDIDIRRGSKRVVGVSHVFSVVVGKYLISKTGEGFFYLNLDDPSDNDMMFFPSEMITQPIVDEEKLFFICRDGVRCYSI